MSFIKHNFDPKRHTEYIPRNPEKYIGKTPIISRSSWELSFMKWCDSNPSILKWSSETIEIPYSHPFFKSNNGLPQTRRYYPDFYLEVLDSSGELKKYVIERKFGCRHLTKKQRKKCLCLVLAQKEMKGQKKE